MSALTHHREGVVDIWDSPDDGISLRMWMATPTIILSQARGHFTLEMARAFLGYLEANLKPEQRYTGLHDWGGITGYDTETRKAFTRWTDAHRKSFHRIVIYTESRLVRMGIATAKLVLGGVVEAVASRRELNELIATAK